MKKTGHTYLKSPLSPSLWSLLRVNTHVISVLLLMATSSIALASAPEPSVTSRFSAKNDLELKIENPLTYDDVAFPVRSNNSSPKLNFTRNPIIRKPILFQRPLHGEKNKPISIDRAPFERFDVSSFSQKFFGFLLQPLVEEFRMVADLVPLIASPSFFSYRSLLSLEGRIADYGDVDLRFPGPPNSDLACFAEITDAGVGFEYTGPIEGITTPVLIKEWRFGGVKYTDYFSDQRNRHMDCRLALALSRLGDVLKNIGVTEVIWSSAYRPVMDPEWSPEDGYEKHTLGIAIDIHGFVFAGDLKVTVADHYEKGLGFQRDHLCYGTPLTREGFLLRLAVCRMDASDLFSEILTPDYDAGHWNHLHVATFHPLDRERRRHKKTALLEVPMESIPGWAIARLSRADQEKRRWEKIANAPWPERYSWLKDHLQERWSKWTAKSSKDTEAEREADKETTEEGEPTRDLSAQNESSEEKEPAIISRAFIVQLIKNLLRADS